MKLKMLRIENYRSCKNVGLELGPMHALVGANNAGKSTILRALDFLFNPSTTKVDAETFWNGDSSNRLWIEAVFCDLTESEKENLSGYLRPDGQFHMARSAVLEDEGIAEHDIADSDSKVTIGQHFCKPMPKYEWLCESKINGANVNQWWNDRDTLVVNGKRFDEHTGGNKPNVGQWKEYATSFAENYLTESDFEDSWADNPRGYAGVLKGTLPLFILVPAVRELKEEAKVTKSSPLGRILFAVIESVTESQRASLDQSLLEMKRLLNREGGAERIPSIATTEARLNELVKEYMQCELEIEFQPPTLEVLLTTPRILADDGFRNTVENKGHGLQRAIIFSILQCYSDLVIGKGGKKERTMIFAVEEPEIYMHPQAQRTVRRVFRNIAEAGDQVFFSTHSALMVDVEYFDEIIRIEAIPDVINGTKTVSSRAWQLSMADMIQDLKSRFPRTNPTPQSMRDRYSHAYHPNRAEGFFAKKVILVEGATEQYALPIYASAAKFHLDNLNIAVVDCGGKGPMDRLYRVFNELGIPCFLVFDYDSDKNDSDLIAASEMLLQLAGAPNGVPARILLHDSVAVFPKDWETDLKGELPNYDQLASEARDKLVS